MMRCPECDWELEDADELCPNCGAVLSDYGEEGGEDFEA
jgi:rubrerythrin